MAKANVILQNSVLWNLREVTELAEKIKKHCGDVDCISWRYPLTTCSQLEIFKLLQNNRNLDNYTYILELTYDRLLYIFNLIVKYLESSESLEGFRPCKSVHRPRTLSLASVLYMIWERIKAHVEASKKGFVETSEKLELECSSSSSFIEDVDVKKCKSSTFTQSEVCSITICSCCEMVQQFVTQLVLEMEAVFQNQDLTSAISMERKLIRESLLEMTNWSAMSRWLGAIAKDFAAISEKAESATITSRKLKNRLDSGEKIMKTRMEQYEEQIRKLETHARECEKNLVEIKRELNETAKEKKRAKEEVEEMNSKMAASVANYEKKIAQLKKSYESKLSKQKEKKLKEETEKEVKWKAEIESERKKLEEVESENEKLLETISRLQEDVNKLNEETNDRMNRCKALEEEVEALKKENSDLRSVIGEKQKIIDDYSQRIMDAFPELNGSSKPSYKASGNPLTDMENQMEANRLRINLLLSENEKLKNTVDKLRLMKG